MKTVAYTLMLCLSWLLAGCAPMVVGPRDADVLPDRASPWPPADLPLGLMPGYSHGACPAERPQDGGRCTDTGDCAYKIGPEQYMACMCDAQSEPSPRYRCLERIY